MRLITSLILLFACSSMLVGKDILPYAINKNELPNGLKVVTIPYDSPGLAAFYIVVRVGSRDEIEKGKTGFAHFFEHMMFRGTEKYTKEQYSEALKSTGASANANTSLDRTVYHMTGNALKLDKMFELESDRFQNLSYSVQDFKTEAGAVKGEYTKNFSSPYGQLNESVNNTAFDAHTYKHTTMGFFDDVVDMPNQYEFSKEFFKRYYRPEYCTIIVVGDVTSDKVNELATKYFGNWKRGNYVTQIPEEPKQKAPRYFHLQVPQFPPFLDINFKGPAYSSANNDYQALSILSEVLFSESSSLYKKLVINDQVARNIYSGLMPTRDPYLFSASASLVDAEKMGAVKKEILGAIEKIKTTPVEADVLKATKDRIKYSFALSMDSPDAIANAVSMYVWVTGDPQEINKSYELFESVTAADLQRVAKKYLVPESMTIGTISPDEKAKLD